MRKAKEMKEMQSQEAVELLVGHRKRKVSRGTIQ